MADLSEQWRKERAILGSEAEQMRARCWEMIREFAAVEETDDSLVRTQHLIDFFRNDERLSMSLLGTLAEVGFLHCMLGEIE